MRRRRNVPVEKRFKVPVPEWNGTDCLVIVAQGIIHAPVGRVTIEFHEALFTAAQIDQVLNLASVMLSEIVATDFNNAVEN